ncbi:MAG: wax ester/triacylglycerol synthase domain-containing protein [Pseudomonadota bacterium]
MKRPLGLADNFFLRTESRAAPQHMAGLMIFKKPPNSGQQFLKIVFNEMRGFSVNRRPFNEILSKGAIEKIIPAFETVDQTSIDIDYHFRHSALPKPGGELELGQLVSRLYANPLDMTKPLWELHLIEGLSKQRFAIFCKIHHALADGMSGMKILFDWLTPIAGDDAFIPVWHCPEEHLESDAEHDAVITAGLPHQRKPSKTIRDARGLAGSIIDLQLTGVKLAGKFLLGSAALSLPFRAPRTQLNAKISGARRIATQDIEFARFKRLAEQLNVTINVIVLAIIGDALKRYIQEVTLIPEKTMIALNLVSLRREGRQEKAGNMIGFILADLATDSEDIIERVERIRASTEEGKNYLRGLSPLSAQLVSAMPMVNERLALAAGFEDYIDPSQNIMVSNLPGFLEDRYLGRCKLDSLYLPSVIDHGNPLLITVVTCVKKLCFTVVACPDVATSSQNIAVYLPWAISRLEVAASKAAQK